jgi:hypothetical protein
MKFFEDKVLDYIKSRVRFGGHPSNEAIRTRFTLKDRTEVQDVLDVLEGDGRLIIIGSGPARRFKMPRTETLNSVTKQSPIAIRSIASQVTLPKALNDKVGFAAAPIDVLISLITRWSETDGSPAVIAFDLALAALERFEGPAGEQGKPRVSAKILRAAVEAEKPLHEFCTELMELGFAHKKLGE